MNNAWTISTREEVIAALWAIAAILAYANGLPSFIWGPLTIKAIADTCISLVFSVVEWRDG